MTTSIDPKSNVLPVVIVGAGPVGLVAALAVRHEGFPAVVLEAEPADRIRPGSRATFLYRESLDFLETIAPGVTQPLIAKSYGWTQLRTTFRGKDVYFRKFEAAAPGEHGIAVSQLDQERILMDRCRAEGVEFRWNHRVTDVTSDEHAVTLTFDGQQNVVARYVVAADGAGSAVRRAVGLTLDGERSNTAFVIVDLEANTENPSYRERAFHYQHPAVGGRNVLVAPFGGGLRVDLQCGEDDDVESFQTDPKLSEWVHAVTGDGYTLPPKWVSTYRFNRSVASSYCDKSARVLLAGEAAHLFPPFGGARGLNSGIPDAVFAVEAIGAALRATDPAVARDLIRAVAQERRAAGLANRDAASLALERMEAAEWWRKAQLRVAALLAPRAPRIARWLDRGPTAGGDGRVSVRSRY